MHLFQFEIIFVAAEDGSEVRQTGVTAGTDYANAVTSLKDSFGIKDQDISSIVLSDMRSGVLIARQPDENRQDSDEPVETEE